MEGLKCGRDGYGRVNMVGSEVLAPLTLKEQT